MERLQRVFKTAWFSKASAKAHISDNELCEAMQQVLLGQCDDLGGGVFKKRLSRNMVRSIILAKGRQFWVYEFIYAKKDLANISSKNLAGFRKLARSYERLTETQVDLLLKNEDWTEICNDNKARS